MRSGTEILERQFRQARKELEQSNAYIKKLDHNQTSRDQHKNKVGGPAGKVAFEKESAVP